MNIAIVAASSAVPLIELDAGAEKIRAAGFDVMVSPQVRSQHFTYAGTDEERARAFHAAAMNPDVDAIWMARGGYGASRIIPLLDQYCGSHLPAKKLLIGYSDVTVLHEYVRQRWGWSALHAPMPASTSFLTPDPKHWRAMIDLINRKHPGDIWGKIKWHTAPKIVQAKLVGGNLSLWASAIGTPFGPKKGTGAFLFLEDVHEKYYRIDRMMTQLRLAGLLEDLPLLLLGDFTDCDDDNVMMVQSADGGKQPLRPGLNWDQAMAEIFETLGVPLASGLPVGHGPNYAPLPLGAEYRIEIDGTVKLMEWDWIGG